MLPLMGWDENCRKSCVLKFPTHIYGPVFRKSLKCHKSFNFGQIVKSNPLYSQCLPVTILSTNIGENWAKTVGGLRKMIPN